MTPQETARAILDWYGGDASKWGKGDACDCVLAVADRVTQSGDDVARDQRAFDSFRDAARDVLGLSRVAGEIPRWNDAPERTFADVVALLERIASEPAPEPPAEAP